MTDEKMLSFEAASLVEMKLSKSHGICKVTNLYSHWLLLVPRVRMQILMAGVGISNYLLRTCLGTCAVLMVHEYNWDMQFKGMLLGAFFWGYLAGNLFAGAISARLGAGMVLACAAITWSALAIAIPMVADLGFGYTWMLLTLLGLAESPLMPTTMQLISAYVPASERGCSLAARALSMRFGQIVASVLAPLICSQAGWRATFAIFGTVSLMLAFLWLGFAMTKSREAGMEIARKMWEDTCDADVVATGAGRFGPPARLATSRSVEMPGGWQGTDGRGTNSKGGEHGGSFLPLWALKHPGFLALLAVHCSSNFAMYTIMSWGPSYFTEVLELPLESVGLYLMLPAAFSGVGSILGGLCTDWLQSRRCPLLTMRRGILCPAALASGLALVLFGNLRSIPFASLAMITAALFMGVLDTAMNAVYLDLAPQNAVALVSLGNGVATLPGAAGPALVAVLLETTGLWSLVWGIIAACFVVSSAVFAIFGSTEDIEKRPPKYMQV
ncbi:unnamed protein product [Durusdinium trenchii]|uniref:Major facilitator superfamily (MFS) profile domain-containing protein n=1 Tax=Durusdinium trenchii TaxID=1381693 RepID=A0ABP0SY19_9DINO